MSLFVKNTRLFRRGLPAFALVAALGLSGCGGGDGDESSASDGNDTTEELADDVVADESLDEADADEPGDADAPDPVAVLPFETDVPEGFKMLPASCDPGEKDDPDRPKGNVDDAGDEDDPGYSTWITYAVPEGWEGTGWGSAGSGGGMMSADEDLRFRVDDGDSRGEVKVEVTWDSKDLDGTVTDSSGEPWESFDYDMSVGDKKTTITYDNVATVEVGDQEADLFFLDQAQAPDFVSRTQYKVRLEALELPRQGTDGTYELMSESFVAVIEFDAKDTPLDQDSIESLVGSFVMPQCSYDYALEDMELMLNLDLNGDGHIRNAEDVQKELQEMQEELQAQLEEERQNPSDD